MLFSDEIIVNGVSYFGLPYVYLGNDGLKYVALFDCTDLGFVSFLGDGHTLKNADICIHGFTTRDEVENYLSEWNIPFYSFYGVPYYFNDIRSAFLHFISSNGIAYSNKYFSLYNRAFTSNLYLPDVLNYGSYVGVPINTYKYLLKNQFLFSDVSFPSDAVACCPDMLDFKPIVKLLGG